MSRVAKLAGGRRNGTSPLSSPGSSDENPCQVPRGTRFALASEWPSLPLRIMRAPTAPLVPTAMSGGVRKRACCIRRSGRTGLRFGSGWKRAAGCRSSWSASSKSTLIVGDSKRAACCSSVAAVATRSWSHSAANVEGSVLVVWLGVWLIPACTWSSEYCQKRRCGIGSVPCRGVSARCWDTTSASVQGPYDRAPRWHASVGRSQGSWLPSSRSSDARSSGERRNCLVSRA